VTQMSEPTKPPPRVARSIWEVAGSSRFAVESRGVTIRPLRGLCCAAIAVTVALAAAAGSAQSAEPALARALQHGGLVLVIRHAATDFSKPDQDPVDLSDCRTQRNLSAQGRADARTIGRGARRLHLRVGTVLTSPFCRTRETARLAFGRATVSRALLNTVNAIHNASWRKQIRDARRLLGTKPPPGRLTVLVTHGSVVTDATGQILEEGETLVFRPRGLSRFALVGRILPREWRTLRASAS